MTQGGARLLSLDGGGTRGLSSLYILKKLMDPTAQGQGGRVRPCEHFDLIGGAGLNGLCALLFARFCYTIDDAIEFAEDLYMKLDDVEAFRTKILQDEVDANEWEEAIDSMNKVRDPKEQLEELRMGIIDLTWEQVIRKNVTEPLETYQYMENGNFNFKAIPREMEAGRPKVFVVASESKGYGANGGNADHRVYHVPMLHRTYDYRNSKPTYTYYAIGLGTVAHPEVIKPGVTFPDFITTGRHTANNPTLLVLEESRKCWPGLPISALISIGTGTFDLERSYLTPMVKDAANAVLKISEENRKLADEIQKYMIPFDKNLSNAYFRLDIPIMDTFYEYSQKSKIHANLASWFDVPKVSTQFGYAAALLKTNSFPTSPEDLVALASLSSLTRALSIAGYEFESLIISDIITNFILYESAADNEGSFRKLGIAFEAERLASAILAKHKAYVDGNGYSLPDDVSSEAALIYRIAAYDDPGHGGNQQLGELLTIFDYVAAIYYCLPILREGDKSKLNKPRLLVHMKQLSSVLDMPRVTPQVTDPLIVDKMEELLKVAAISAMCEAASVQLLHNVKSLAYNGSFIMQIKHVLQEINLRGMNDIIVEPIANMYALWMEKTTQYEDIDEGIAAILMAAPHNTSLNKSWALVNLAVKRTLLAKPEDFEGLDDDGVISRCLKLRISRAEDWKFKHLELLVPTVQRGWFGLAEKGLGNRELNSSELFEVDDNFISRVDLALQETVKAGYPFIMKKFLESMGVELCKNRINVSDSQGLTPYHLACKHRAPKEVFRLLQVLTMEKNHKDNKGRTPLSYCFPKQDEVPPVYQSIVDMIKKFSLPTIAPIDKPEAYGGRYRGNPKRVDPRTQSFRLIIDQLLCRNANPVLEDDSGMTPAHRAAKEGWGDNLDVLFMHGHGEFPTWTRELLNMLDNEGHSVIDYARMAGNKGDIQGREDIIEDEMKKRDIPIPQRKNLPTEILQNQWITIPMGRTRPPANPEQGAPPAPTQNYTMAVPQQPTRPPEVHVYQDPSIPSTSPALRPSPSQFPSVQSSSPKSSAHAVSPACPPAQVYQDPRFQTNTNNTPNYAAPSPSPSFPAAQVYRDPNFPSSAPSPPAPPNMQPQYRPNPNQQYYPSHPYPPNQQSYPPQQYPQNQPYPPHQQHYPPQQYQPIQQYPPNLQYQGQQQFAPQQLQGGKEGKRSKFLGKFMR